MRKRLAGILISLMLANTVLADVPFQGHAEFDDEYTEPDKELFTGKKETLEKKDIIESLIRKLQN